jgi:LmbE family N-acetylglucosaminyl deacetylase
MSKIILIVAAHTDDEALGCGGTIARHVAEGDIVYSVFVADGVSSRGHEGKVDRSNRNIAAENARIILGIKENYYMDLPDNRLDSIPLLDIVRPLEEIIRKLQPQFIYTHHHGDLNIDHRITHQAVLTACRPLPGSRIQAIYSFEVMSSTEWATPTFEQFAPNHFVEITDFINTKIKSLKAYELEIREAPHSRSYNNLEYLARHRGHTVGLIAAEAFFSIRTIR